MLGSGRPDGSAARARLRATTPGWVPSLADIDEAAKAASAAVNSSRTPTRQSPTPAAAEDEAARHALPEAPPPVWRIDAAAARGLLSLALAAVAGALVVVLVGWPRGTAVGDDGNDVASAPTDAATNELLVEPSPATDEVVVDVDGKVKRPGVVALATGSRVIDAIEAAGGLRRSGDTGALNLAEMLIDGQQIVVPKVGAAESTPEMVPGSSTGAPTPGTSAITVSINTAETTELETLPGIGPVLAAAIVQWRTDNGAFTSLEQLQEVSGIGPATYAELAPLVRL